MRTANPKLSQLIAEFTTIYDGQPWFGDSVCKVLEKVTPTIAFWQPTSKAHSIAQLISHMIYWRQALIQRLEDNLDYHPSVKSEDNWRSNEQLKKVGLKSLKNSLGASQIQLLTLLTKQKDTLLKKPYSTKASFQDLINGILQHDLYHTGQMAYLKSIYLKDK